MDCVKAGYDIITTERSVKGNGVKVVVYSINVVSDGTAGLVEIYNDSQASNDPVLTLTGTINKGVVFNFPNGMTFPVDCFVSPDAHATSVTVVYTQP